MKPSKENKIKKSFMEEIKHFFSQHRHIRKSDKTEVKVITFVLSLENNKIGELSYSENKWAFKYSEDFINSIDSLNFIVGFPDQKKTYQSEELWPFFKVRIPGLKQPQIKEILKSENIDSTDDVKLLERFGRKTISNPYELEVYT